MKKRVTVIGNGALSLSIAAQMGKRGADITYVDLQKNPQIGKEAVLHVTGIETYDVTFTERTTVFDSVADADIVAITVTGSMHQNVIDGVLPYLKNGQIIAFFPACFGAISFMAAVQGKSLDLTVCEAVSFPCVCEAKGVDGICIQNIKSSMRVAVKPASRTEETLALLNAYFDIFTPAKNVLETSLDNMNMTLHPLPVLMNIGTVEKDPASFRHYVDGISPTVGRLMEQVDAERMAIGEAFGLQLTSAYDQLVLYYGERNLPTMWEYASSLKGPYVAVKGYGLHSRYVEEDIPYLLVAAASLGKSCGVATPVMDMCIQLANVVMQADYVAGGYSLERMGFAGLSKEEILERV